jgi:hypothetical protein
MTRRKETESVANTYEGERGSFCRLPNCPDRKEKLMAMRPWKLLPPTKLSGRPDRKEKLMAMRLISLSPFIITDLSPAIPVDRLISWTLYLGLWGLSADESVHPWNREQSARLIIK